jgi:hypothetical protein
MLSVAVGCIVGRTLARTGRIKVQHVLVIKASPSGVGQRKTLGLVPCDLRTAPALRFRIQNPNAFKLCPQVDPHRR